MHVRRFLPLFLSILAPSLAIAQAPQQTVRRADGSANGTMESIFIPPKEGAPFSFILAAEWTRSTGTGGSFTLVNERRIFRDSKGRIYQERAALVPKNGDMKTFVTTIQITDPDKHTWYNCIVATRVCDLYRYRLSSTDNFQPYTGITGASPGGKVSHRHEDLGVSSTLGEDTHGYRETTILEPWVMGNDKPMVTTREFWYSPRLAVNLISIVDSPLSGKQVFTARELTTSEPDPRLFEVPADYKIADHLDDEN